ncbi:MAG: AAA family ATPase [Pseudomonadota bacterium]
MEHQLRLESLYIKGFRAFNHLELPALANINLIVGKNNTGKTSFLEALRLYFSQGDRQRITELLQLRDEYSFKRSRPSLGRDDLTLAFESLFYGRPQLIDRNQFFLIGPKFPGDSDEYLLSISFAWLRETISDQDNSVRLQQVEVSPEFEPADVIPGFRIGFGGRSILTPLSRMDSRPYARRGAIKDETPLVYLPSTGLDNTEIGRIWDTVALTEDEDEVLKALRVISSSIEKIVLVQTPSESRTNGRIMMVKLNQYRDPIPFKSLGEGMNHLLSVFLALIRARNGVLLIDEVENGVHYSVQAELWDLIFVQARQWNIQVFTTSHSWDCVTGFQIAALRHKDVSAQLIRLEADGRNVRAVTFTPAEIEIARHESIEVR